MFEELKDKIWGWFKNSGSIVLARLEVLSGFVIGAVNVLDWSPLLSAGLDAGFTWVQGVTLGSMLLVKGIVSEWVRRSNAKVIENTLVPTAPSLEDTNIVVKTKKKKTV